MVLVVNMTAKQTGAPKKKFDLIELNENISRLINESDRALIIITKLE